MGDDIIYGPDGSSLGTWTDFWSRYELPDVPLAEDSTVGRAEGFSGLGAITMGASLFQGAASVYAAYETAKTQQALYDVQEEIAKINERMYERQAQSALRQSEFKIAALTLRAGRIKSSQRASFAANGISITGGGTTTEVFASTDLMKEIDMNNERLNGIMSAWGYRFKGLGEQVSAAEARLRGAGNNPLLAAAGELGRQSARVGTQYYNYRKSGLLGG